jgi:hypothetical protein
MELQTPSGLVRAQANQNITVLASGTYDTDADSADYQNPNFKGVLLTIDITAEAGTHALVVTIQGKDPASGKYSTILASASLTGVGTTQLRVYPGLTAASNLVASDVLPAEWRVNFNHTKTASSTFTMSVGASLLN